MKNKEGGVICAPWAVYGIQPVFLFKDPECIKLNSVELHHNLESGINIDCITFILKS